jgi:hypothetical protein
VEIAMVKHRVQTRLERKRTGPHEWLVVTRRPLADAGTLEAQASWDATDALTLPQVRYRLSVLLMEVFCTLNIPYLCRQVHRQ